MTQKRIRTQSLIALSLTIGVWGTLFLLEADVFSSTNTPTSPISTTTSQSTLQPSPFTPSPTNTPEIQTHSATISYRVPHDHTNQMTVSVEIQNQTVVDITTRHEVTSRHSQADITRFDAGYKQHVIGQPIQDLEIDTIGRASLTTDAFNQAIKQINASLS